MAIGVDSSKWKPRKMNGTPAAKFRHRIALAIISLGFACGVIFHITPFTKNIRQATEKLYEESEEVAFRKYIIAKGLRPQLIDDPEIFSDY